MIILIFVVAGILLVAGIIVFVMTMNECSGSETALIAVSLPLMSIAFIIGGTIQINTSNKEFTKAEQEIKSIAEKEVVYIQEIEGYEDFLKISKYIDVSKPVKVTLVDDMEQQRINYIWQFTDKSVIAHVRSVE